MTDEKSESENKSANEPGQTDFALPFQKHPLIDVRTQSIRLELPIPDRAPGDKATNVLFVDPSRIVGVRFRKKVTDGDAVSVPKAFIYIDGMEGAWEAPPEIAEQVMAAKAIAEANVLMGRAGVDSLGRSLTDQLIFARREEAMKEALNRAASGESP